MCIFWFNYAFLITNVYVFIKQRNISMGDQTLDIGAGIFVDIENDSTCRACEMTHNFIKEFCLLTSSCEFCFSSRNLSTAEKNCQKDCKNDTHCCVVWPAISSEKVIQFFTPLLYGEHAYKKKKNFLWFFYFLKWHVQTTPKHQSYVLFIIIKTTNIIENPITSSRTLECS